MGFTLNGCWEKQDHDITRPEAPHYSFSGYLVDMDSIELTLSGAGIDLSPVQVPYDIEVSPQSVVADCTGFFQFDTVYTGDYLMEIYRDSSLVSRRNFSMQYEKIERDIPVPKPLVSRRGYQLSYLSDNPRIHWHNNQLVLFGLYDPGGNLSPRNKLYFCEPDRTRETMYVTGELNNPLAGATVFLGSDRYFYGGSSTSVTTLYPHDASIKSTQPVQDRFTDLTWDGRHFWSVFRDQLAYRGLDFTTVNYTVAVKTGSLNLITGDGVSFWVYNAAGALLLNVDYDGNILGSYHPVDRTAPDRWIEIYDMDYAVSSNQLWISAVNSNTLYSFNKR